MTKKITRSVSILLAGSMIIGGIFSLTGCGKKPPVEEDVVTTISVSSEELAPEITDEDLGITRKDVSELMTITGYQSWEGYSFLVMKNNSDDSSTVTVQIEDQDLFDSLYRSRLFVYVEPSYSSVSQDDPMYASYARGLRSLGNEFYTMCNESENSSEEDALIESGENTDTVAEENILDEIDTEAENSDEVQEDTNNVSDGEANSEAADTSESEEDADALSDSDDVNDETSIQTVEEFINGGWADTEEAKKEKEERNKLNQAIEEYMQSVSLNRATKILVYALDGELLGEMTPAKLDDYVSAFDIAPTPYETEDGTVYISDLKDGVEYEVSGYISDDAGNCEYMIKNDSKRPVTIYLHSDTDESEEIIFQNYMETSLSTGWYLVENQYGFTSTDKTYIVRIEHKNSDADLAESLDENKVLRITELSDEPQTVVSMYSAIVNDTDYAVHIVADTGDEIILDSKQAIGIHKSAYNKLTYEFEGTENVSQE